MPPRTALTATLAAALTGCTAIGTVTEDAHEAVTGQATQVESATPLPDAATARTALAGLPVVDRKPAGLPRYSRDAFGASWSDVDGNGCNQRDDVLLRDALAGTARVARQGNCDHDVLAGSWQDPYSATVITLDDLKDPAQAQAIQIDHVVALSEAWRSGAWSWSDATRRQFANSLDVLVAADGPTNASKSDHDPAGWRPRQANQCSYARRWITVKDAWTLGVDESERRALDEMLDLCD